MKTLKKKKNTTQEETKLKKKKKRLKNEQSLSETWDNFSQPNIPAITVSEVQWRQVEKQI